MIRAVIFDFNGVLVDDEIVHFELFREVLSQEGVSFSAEDYHERYLGLDDRGCFEAALIDSGQEISRARLDDLIARKASRYTEVAADGLSYFPGSIECLSSMADHWPVAICSGALRPEIEFTLGRLGLSDRVTAIVSAEDAERCKPDPEGYLIALDALRSSVGEDLEAAHCLVLEDSMAGIQAAKGAGMWAVGLSNTYPADDLRSAGADAVMDSLTELSPEWIRRFFAPEISP